MSAFRGVCLSYDNDVHGPSSAIIADSNMNQRSKAPPPISNKVLKSVLKSISGAYRELKTEILTAYPWFDHLDSFPQRLFFEGDLNRAADSVGTYSAGMVSLMSQQSMLDYVNGFNDHYGSMTRFVENFNRKRHAFLVPNIDVEEAEVKVYVYHDHPDNMGGVLPFLKLYGMENKYGDDEDY